MALTDFKDWLERKPAGPKPRKRIKQASAKRSTELRTYSKLRKAYLTRGQCEAKLPVCTKRMTEIHHAKGRGPNLNNVNTWVGCCQSCHRWIHEHPGQARKIGLLK